MKRLWNKFKRLFKKKGATQVAPTPVRKPVKPSARSINKEGLDMICHFEGFYPNAYICSGGVVTIGWGTTIYPNGKRVKMSDRPCTRTEAREWLNHELDEKEVIIADWLQENRINVNSNQFSALVSFAYNLGCGPIIEDWRSLNNALLTGEPKRVVKAIKLYNKAGGKKLRGLVRRRNAESKLYLKTV